jgi:hypothetical protein
MTFQRVACVRRRVGSSGVKSGWVVHALRRAGGSISEKIDLETWGVFHVDERRFEREWGAGVGFKTGLNSGCEDFGQWWFFHVWVWVGLNRL